MENLITNDQGYIVEEATGKPVAFYVCDPAKNTACGKTLCRAEQGGENEAEFGFCASCADPACQKEGTRPFYKKLNDKGYFGREYIEEEGQA